MPRLSLCPLTIIRATHRELVEAAAAGGFDAVGFRLIAPRPGDPVHPIEGANGLGDLRKLMSDHGIALFDIESYGCRPLPSRRRSDQRWRFAQRSAARTC